MKTEKNLMSYRPKVLTTKNPSHPSLKKGRSKIAFTLAEVLITLGIIGVVAALTISNFVENYRERQTVIRLKQTYSILNQAFLQMVEENGTLDTWADDSKEFLRQEFLKHLTVVKSCNNDYHCFVNTSGMTHGRGVGLYSYTLNNGAVIGIGTRYTNVSGGYNTCFLGAPKTRVYTGKCGHLVVDINGDKGPNKDAQDIFYFLLYADSIIPLGAPIHTKSSWVEDFNRSCSTKRGLDTCTAWVIYNENMDYLRCPEKLGWGKAMKCK